MTFKIFTTSQPTYLSKLITVQSPRSTNIRLGVQLSLEQTIFFINF